LQLCINSGLFAIHTELLTVTVMQPGGQCNMTTSLLADDPNAYMVKMCSRGYYGPLCSLCLLHNAPPGEARHGRTGNLNCQKCRCVSALSCNLLHCLASCCLCWAGFCCWFAAPVCIFTLALLCCQYGQCVVLSCLCTYLADMAADASHQQHSVILEAQ
jgi:hypothetical protein